MSNLNKIKDEIFSNITNQFTIFYSKPLSVNNDFDTIDWAGEKISEFIECAKSLDVKTLYYSEIISVEENEKYKGEIVFLELCFIHNHFIHSFSSTADFFINDYSVVADIENGFIQKINNKSNDDLFNEIIEFIEKEYPELFENKYDYITGIKYYYEKEGIEDLDELNLKYDLQKKLKKVENKIEKYFEKIVRNRENELMESLVDECINWHKENNLKKVTNKNIKIFLNEKEIKLSTVATDALYLKVNKI